MKRRKVWRGLSLGVCLLIAGCGGNGGPGASDDTCANDSDCDDGIFCTFDACGMSESGRRTCSHTARSDRCAPGEACVGAGAAPWTGCVALVRLWCAGRQEWEACEPDDACAAGLGYCRGGECIFETRDCPDLPCMEGRGCDAATGLCRYVPATDGLACERDGLECTQDECLAGVCTTTTDTCACSEERPCSIPADPCLGEPTCENGVCVDHPRACPPSERICHENVCEPGTGRCIEQPVTDGTACSDDLACTTGESCFSGICTTEPRICAPTPCQSMACVEPTGCVGTPIDEGLDCDDGDPCNGPDRCQSGACLPFLGPIDCDDLDPCTADACDPLSGQCRHTFLPDCCGNGVVEEGEECDGGRAAAGCVDCRWRLALLAASARAPAVAWGQGEVGVVAYQEEAAQSPIRLVIRRVRHDGRVEDPVEVPGAVKDAVGFRPSVASIGDGGFLLATFEQDGLVLRRFDAELALQGRVVASGLTGASAGERLIVAVLEDAAFVAFEAASAGGREVRAVRVPLAGLAADVAASNGPDEVVVRESARLSDLCVGRGDILIATVTKDGDGVWQPWVDFLDADLTLVDEVLVQDTEVTQPPGVRCAVQPGSDGTRFLLTVGGPMASDAASTGNEVLSRRVSANPVELSDPVTLVSNAYRPGDTFDMVQPVLASSLAATGQGAWFAAPFAIYRIAPALYAFDLRVLALDDQGVATGVPASPGSDMPNWVTQVSLVGTSGAAMLVVGLSKGDLAGDLELGQVWARFLPDR